MQKRLARGIETVRLGARVLEVVPEGQGVLVRWQTGEQVTEERFDRVVLAVSPDVAGNIFRPLASATRRIPTVRVESSVLCGAVELDDGVEPAACSHHVVDTFPPHTITLRTQFSKGGSRTEALHAMPTGAVVSTCPLDAAEALHTA